MKWDVTDREKLLNGSIFDVYSVESVAPDGRSGSFLQVAAPDWVTVLPLVHDDVGRLCFLMVRQYRHGSESVTLEFPAGTVESGEIAKDAALRELLEETGCRPYTLTHLGEVSPNPAFMKNRMNFYVAEGMEWVRTQRLDEHEIIETELVPVNEVVHGMGTGLYDNCVMVAGLFFFLRWRGNVGEIS